MNQFRDKVLTSKLTTAQRTVFFEDAAQMGIPNSTVVQFQTEGLDGVEDLADFDKETIERSGGTANSIIEPNKLGRVDQSLLGLGPKYKGWCQNRGTCGRSRVRISYPSLRAL